MTTPCLQPGPRDTRLSAGGRGGGQSVYIWEDVVHTQVLTEEKKKMKVNQDINREALGHRSPAIFSFFFMLF